VIRAPAEVLMWHTPQAYGSWSCCLTVSSFGRIRAGSGIDPFYWMRIRLLALRCRCHAWPCGAHRRPADTLYNDQVAVFSASILPLNPGYLSMPAFSTITGSTSAMSALPMPDLQLATMASESAYADATRPALGLLVVYTAMGAICAPLLLALFYFSTARSRRTPLFIIVVFDVVLGIALSAWMVIEEVCDHLFCPRTLTCNTNTLAPAEHAVTSPHRQSPFSFHLYSTCYPGQQLGGRSCPPRPSLCGFPAFFNPATRVLRGVHFRFCYQGGPTSVLPHEFFALDSHGLGLSPRRRIHNSVRWLSCLSSVVNEGDV
jgi:hypothetical protein